MPFVGHFGDCMVEGSHACSKEKFVCKDNVRSIIIFKNIADEYNAQYAAPY